MNKAYEIIDAILRPQMEELGFAFVEDAKDENQSVVMYQSETQAYCVKLDLTANLFLLKKGELTEDGKVEEWQSLSRWLYDVKQGTTNDAEVIGKDFLDIIVGPKGLAKTKDAALKKKKKSKDDERNVDSIFFFNRLVSYFPELKDKMNEERIKFGKIRFAKLTDEYVAPQCQSYIKSSDADIKKMCELFNDMYEHGDIEVRAILIHGILNYIDDATVEKIKAEFSEDLTKVFKCSRHLKGKDIKPEKVKKKSNIMKKAMENAQNSSRLQSPNK